MNRSVVDGLRRVNEELRRDNAEMRQRLVDHERQFRSELEELQAVVQSMSTTTAADDERNRDLIRHGLRVVRSELDGLRATMPVAPLDHVEAHTPTQPELSIAVPGYNRPDELELCLQSVVDQLASIDTAVEVWITDDCSTDPRAREVAHRFATSYDFVGYRANKANIGLERNLLECCRPCRGEYVWILGNDDVVRPEGLSVITDTLRSREHDVVLFAKTRIDRTGRRELRASAGTTPPGVLEGQRLAYASVLDLARETGIISAFGFISSVVLRREPFVETAPEPYFGLSMYPQLGVLLENFGRSSVLFHNVSVVDHRTQTDAERLAEAAGRREEGFMAGGAERNARWFGATYAALLQRVIDRSSLTARDFADLPELLFREPSLLAWIGSNRELQHRSGVVLDPSIEADADRFIEAASSVARGDVP